MTHNVSIVKDIDQDTDEFPTEEVVISPEMRAVTEKRLRLLENGFEPIPLTGKRPLYKGWTTATITPELVRLWALNPSLPDTGIRTRNCPAVDCDIWDEETSAGIAELVAEELGQSELIRLNNKGFIAVYGLEGEPVEDIEIYGIPPERAANKPDSAGDVESVEILASGRQFAAFGGKIRWPRKSPLEVEVWQMVQVSRQQLQSLAERIRLYLIGKGWTHVDVDDGNLPKPPVVKNGEPISEKRLRGALKYVPYDMDRKPWVGILAAVKFANVLRGDGRDEDDQLNLAELEDIAVEWSRNQMGTREAYAAPDGTPFDEGDCRHDFRSLRSGKRGATVGSIIHHAWINGFERDHMDRFDLPTEVELNDTDKPKTVEKTGIEETRIEAKEEQGIGKRQPQILITDGFGQFMANPPPPLEELVPDWIEKGITTLVAGKGGSLKSRFGLQTGLLLQNSMKIFEKDAQPATFVYLSAEDDKNEVHRRTHSIGRKFGVPDTTPGHYIDCHAKRRPLMYVFEGHADPETTDFFDDLKLTLKSIPGHKLMVIDSCYDFIRFRGKTKIDEDAVNAVFKGVLDGLCKETDTTILMIWHPSQAGLERGDGTGWSVAWENAPRARLVMTKDKETGYITLTAQKRSHGKDGHSLTLKWDDGALVPVNLMSDTEKETILYRAVIDLASEYAEEGKPLNGHGIKKAHITKLNHKIGYKPLKEDANAALAKAAKDGKLLHRSWKRGRPSGYYPAE